MKNRRAIEKIIKNRWVREGEGLERARILDHAVHPEGLDVERLRMSKRAVLACGEQGQIFSLFEGLGTLELPDRELQLRAGVHVYLPPDTEARFTAAAETQVVRVIAPSREQCRGTALTVRDERFLAACASETKSMRWILTPQYLSRRIFLHHDHTLLSKSGHPVSWFRTTMFDVSGLPENDDGESVFKMSYNYRTEPNVCYEVEGDARVRMALHPYRDAEQAWGPWRQLDADSTYHLNEAEGCPRNKHEVYMMNGHVSLFCLFDPSPTGTERHREGAYSDYGPLEAVLGTREYEAHKVEIGVLDQMVDTLSLARAEGPDDAQEEDPEWTRYARGRDAQRRHETDLEAKLRKEGGGRQDVIRPWMLGSR